MMHDFTVGITKEATSDLKSIYLYIAKTLTEPTYAANQISRIRKEISSLDVFPLRNKQVEWEPWLSQGIRQMPVDHFIVYYSTNESSKTVNVLRVFYGKRNIEGIVKRNLK